MTFAEHLRRRRSYTEAGLALKAAIADMPDTVQTSHQVHVWLRETGASPLAQHVAQEAARRHYPQVLRERAKRAGQVSSRGSGHAALPTPPPT